MCLIARCNWCQESAAIIDGEPTVCPICLHRLDVPPDQCDCEECGSTPPAVRSLFIAVYTTLEDHE